MHLDFLFVEVEVSPCYALVFPTSTKKVKDGLLLSSFLHILNSSLFQEF